ncbi:Uncharacterized protein M6B38_236620 [Iris pallida]|uniref:GIR1-like zinc ribbon domain-containing protein n=1 Tax=Iris pallida TaxID=29817 RepID=A0AAX6DP35_IRIPA|nr:Uncharacterized protein M6B38_236620 [Iris pallida]
MTADIASQLFCDEAEARSRDLATRDLLGLRAPSRQLPTQPTKEDLHLDVLLRVPHGWERRIYVQSGEVYIKKSSPDRIVHDLNLPPPPPVLDQNLLLPPRSDHHQCTLEKVRSALERAGRRKTSRSRRSTPVDGSPSTSSSTSASSSSSKRRAEEEAATRDGPDPSAGSLAAAGCSKCLTYVMVSSSNPRCPRCDSHVPVPPAMVKKPRMEYMNTTDMKLSSPGNLY